MSSYSNFLINGLMDNCRTSWGFLDIEKSSKLQNLSHHISSTENENSRLLTENHELREQIKKLKKQIKAAEYNAYEAGYRDASGGKPSPEHLKAISIPISKTETEVGIIDQMRKSDFSDLVNAVTKAMKTLEKYNIGEIA